MGSFERKEIKYLVTRDQFEKLRRLTARRLAPPAEYAQGDVYSLYYDTPDWLLVNRSLEKPRYKEKLRVRSYGEAQPGSPVFVEIKKKFKGIVYKRRLSCSLEAAKAFLAGMPYEQAVARYPLADVQQHEASLSWASRQIAGEIAWMLKSYEGLRPAMLVGTHRDSFVGIEDPELRITCDTGVCYQEGCLALDQVGEMKPLIAADQRILEIKCLGAYPLWLVDALNACDILPQSVSKVGLAYQAFCAEQATVAAAVAAATAAAPAFAPEQARTGMPGRPSLRPEQIPTPTTQTELPASWAAAVA